MFNPPVEKNDQRILGIGSSKMVWKIRAADDFAVINAFDYQRTDDLPEHWTLKRMIDHNNSKILREYYFTQHVKTIFGDLIPKVSMFKSGEFIEDGRVRYKKELCESVVNSDELFYEMVRIAEEVIEKGWVYLDMKPANLGRRGGKLCIIDTDPKSFYQFPPEHKQYYLMCSYMIILLVSKNYQPYISETTLVQFIVDKELTYDEFLKTYETEPPIDTITKYGNNLYPKGLHVSAVMHPRLFIDAYDGGQGALYGLFRLTKLSIHAPYLAAIAEVHAASRASKVQPENLVLKAGVQVAEAFATTIQKQVEMERAIATAEKAAGEARDAKGSNAEKIYANEVTRADKYVRLCVKNHASAIELLSVARSEYEEAQLQEERRMYELQERKRMSAIQEKRRLNAIKEQRRLNALEEQRRLNAIEEQRRLNALEEQRRTNAFKEQTRLNALEKKRGLNALEEKRRLNALEEQRRINALEETSYPYLKNENNYTTKVSRGKKSKGKGKGTGKGTEKGTGKGKKSRVDRSKAKPSRFKATAKNSKSPF